MPRRTMPRKVYGFPLRAFAGALPRCSSRHTVSLICPMPEAQALPYRHICVLTFLLCPHAARQKRRRAHRTQRIRHNLSRYRQYLSTLFWRFRAARIAPRALHRNLRPILSRQARKRLPMLPMFRTIPTRYKRSPPTRLCVRRCDTYRAISKALLPHPP